MEVTISTCTLAELSILKKISWDTFYNAFIAQNNEADMLLYMKKAFSEQQLKKELLQVDSTFYLAKIAGQTVGYLKINVGAAQNEAVGDAALEIERIYIDTAFIGQGIGRQLMQKALEIAQALGKEKVWLGVWEHNLKAIEFYKKQGFQLFGKHPFILGNDPQTDFLMEKKIGK